MFFLFPLSSSLFSPSLFSPSLLLSFSLFSPSLQAALRNNNIGIGHESIMGILFHHIDADNSGHIDFKEFAAVLNEDETQQEGNFFVGGGRKDKRFIPQVMKTSIGLKRTWEILKTKIEQRCKSASGGVFAMTSPHVLAKMFHEFDSDGGGSLCRKEFERALREKLGMMMISQQVKKKFNIIF